jgi:transposase-like protein
MHAADMRHNCLTTSKRTGRTCGLRVHLSRGAIHDLKRRIEQDHRGIKQRYYPMLGFGSLPSGRRFRRSFEEVREYFRPRHKRKQFVPLAKQRHQFVSRALTLAYLFEAA